MGRRSRRASSDLRIAPPPISREDIRLLGILATGLPIPMVARHLSVSDRTVRRRIRSICDELEVTTAIEAVVWAARRRLI
ncbi:LuxR C-terminal-related transcriptional regulator [Rhizohabitans arisaemae]|uniref:LuxR C-terminal-related transcriptional regulator n=1 Tax=Rhizohabitans arisaemae TaxID=2720610 RepID=UPI0024B20EE3|nr:LuxR C-terminal-related transcriptional regulator [Rhizohabitans arisaemae]